MIATAIASFVALVFFVFGLMTLHMAVKKELPAAPAMLGFVGFMFVAWIAAIGGGL